MRFLQTSWDQVFCASSQIHVTDPGDDRRGYWHEARHKDGAGSACHMAITGYSRRDVCFYVGGADEKIEPLIIHNKPGTVYMGLVTGCEHEVKHVPSAATEKKRLARLRHVLLIDYGAE